MDSQGGEQTPIIGREGLLLLVAVAQRLRGPPYWTVKYFFYQWRDDGLDATICELLRTGVRERAGRTEDPSLVVLDAQWVHAAN
jgi:hypothetical protein